MTNKFRLPRRAIPVLGLFVFASLALTAVAASSASAATQHWYECSQKAPVKKFPGPTCNGSSEGEGSAFGFRSLTGAHTAEYVGSMTFIWFPYFTEVEYKLACIGEPSMVTISNPIGGAAATLKGNLGIRECEVLINGVRSLPECTVWPSPIPLEAEASEVGGVPALKKVKGENLWFNFGTTGYCGSLSNHLLFAGSWYATERPTTRGFELHSSELKTWGGWSVNINNNFNLYVPAAESEIGLREQKFLLAP